MTQWHHLIFFFLVKLHIRLRFHYPFSRLGIVSYNAFLILFFVRVIVVVSLLVKLQLLVNELRSMLYLSGHRVHSILAFLFGWIKLCRCVPWGISNFLHCASGFRRLLFISLGLEVLKVLQFVCGSSHLIEKGILGCGLVGLLLFLGGNWESKEVSITCSYIFVVVMLLDQFLV